MLSFSIKLDTAAISPREWLIRFISVHQVNTFEAIWPPLLDILEYSRVHFWLEVAFHRRVQIKSHLVVSHRFLGFPKSCKGFAGLQPASRIVRESFGRTQSVFTRPATQSAEGETIQAVGERETLADREAR